MGSVDLPDQPDEPSRAERARDASPARPRMRETPDPDERGRDRPGELLGQGPEVQADVGRPRETLAGAAARC